MGLTKRITLMIKTKTVLLALAGLALAGCDQAADGPVPQADAYEARARICRANINLLELAIERSASAEETAELWREIDLWCDDESKAQVAHLETGVIGAEEGALTGKQWAERTDISPIDDSTSVYLTVTPDEQTFEADYLMVRCQENTTSVIWNFDNYLGDDDSDVYRDRKQMLIRLGGEAAETVWLNTSTSNDSVGYWRGGDAIPFIRRMLQHEKMVVRITPYNDNPTTLTYDIAGLSQRIEPLKGACGWN